MGEREDSTVGGVGTRRGSRTRAVSFWRCGTTDPTNAGPRVMWRMMRWNVFLGFAPGLMWLAMGLSRVRTVGGVDSAAIVTGLCMVIIALAFVQWRRIRRVLAHAQSLLCRVQARG
jgi:hypothetical protein